VVQEQQITLWIAVIAAVVAETCIVVMVMAIMMVIMIPCMRISSLLCLNL